MKPNIQFHKVEQGSEAWHKLRAGKLTASNAYIFLSRGMNAALHINNGEENGGGFWANRGHILEDQAIEIYEGVKDVIVERPGFITNDRYPNCGFSPDGMTDRIIEVKCFAEDKHLTSIREMPSIVYAQVQFGMMICENDKSDVVFYNPDLEDDSLCFKIVEIKRDERLIKRFEERLGL